MNKKLLTISIVVLSFMTIGYVFYQKKSIIIDESNFKINPNTLVIPLPILKQPSPDEAKEIEPFVIQSNPEKKPDPSTIKNHNVEIAYLKKKLYLTDEKIQELNKKGYHSNNIIQMYHLSEITHKSIDELFALREKTHVGWGKFIHDQKVIPLQLNMKMRKELSAFSKEEFKVNPPEGMKNPLPSKNKK